MPTTHRHLDALLHPHEPLPCQGAEPEEDQPVHLRYFDVPSKILSTQLALAYTDPQQAQAYKLEALQKLNIPIAPDQTPMEAWVIAMAKENQLPPTLPNPIIGQAAAELCPAWLWFLA